MYIGIAKLITSASSKKVSLSSVVQVLNATCVAVVNGWFLRIGLSSAAAIVPVTTVFTVNRIYESE